MKHNFSAGPSILPQAVFREAAEGVLDLNGTGLSVLEISHRSPDFQSIMDEAVQLVRDIAGLGEEWHVLFLSGGASTQFFMTAMNLLSDNDKAYYLDTGSWSRKAIAEAKRLGNVEVLASSAADGYTHIPKDYRVPGNGRYLHITTNNTIFGTQYHQLPETTLPLVADMSSDILSRPIDIDRFGLIYAGAQKNLGPAGVTLVLIREDFLGKHEQDLPTMLKYRTHIDKESLYNTPPVFPIYVSMLTMRWLKKMGGVTEIAKRNKEKARIMYEAIDTSPLFRGVTAREDRSLMNATFVLRDDTLTPVFLEMCKEADIAGIKGHRSVGGFRASMYNAMPVESVEVLVDVISDFTSKYG